MAKPAQAQDWQLILEMVVTNDGKRMPGAFIEVRKNGSLATTLRTDDKGNVDIPMDPNANYEITFTGSGMIKKKLDIDTRNVPPDDLKGPTYFQGEVDIFPKIDGLDLAILNEPIGKLRYDPDVGGFDADLDYTRKRQAALDKLTEDYQKQKENESKLAAQKQKEYDLAIKAADKAYGAEQWEIAETEYKKAAALMPTETYPSFQLAELETKLIQIRETNAKYDEAIKLADAAFATKDYQNAMANYKKASSYKPDEVYPKDKAKESQDLLASQVKKDQTYLAAIERGDNALKISDLQTAKAAFEEATATKPEETYPKNKLAEINDILGKKEAKEQEYQNAIKLADESLAAKDYAASKSNYEKALQVKPTEAYPQEQITKVNELIAAEAKRDQNYLAAVEKGDNSLQQNDLQAALLAFQEATKIKPEESYPTNKIKEINDIIAKNQAKDQEYQDKIKEADKLFASQSYTAAKTAYTAAGTLKPTETYPQEKIGEIDGILAAEAEKEKNYTAAIAAADKAYEAKDFDAAKTSYTNASQIKPEEKYPQDQLAAIGTILVSMEKEQAQYDDAIKNADEAFAASDLEAAKKFYEEAKGIKANEAYPQTKLDEIAAIIAKNAEKEQAYNDAIAAADAAMNENKLEEAKAKYLEAKGMKAEESYPQEQISKIDGLLAEAAKVEEEYKAALAQGDQAFAAKKYSEAITAFQLASDKKPEEGYPKEKITEAQELIKAAEEKDAQYADAIKRADKSFQEEKYEEAKQIYQEAIAYKEDQYPKDQIAAAEVKLTALAAEKAAAEKLEADFQASMSDGNTKLQAEEFAAALIAFKAASALKPDDQLAKDRIAEVESKQKDLAEKKAEEERLAALQKEYDEKIAAADQLYKAENFKEARSAYQEALAVKAEESYPQEKIDEINERLADAAEQDELYNNSIAAADQLLEKEDFEAAKAKYQEASSIKSEENYPKEKITEIDGKLAALAAAAAEIRLKQEKEEAKRAEFNQLLKEGDELASQSEFNKAIGKYEAAIAVIDEQEPKDKIEEMKAKIAERDAQMAEAEKAAIEEKYNGLIAEADALFKKEDFASASAKYMEALGIKEDQYPRDQIAAIDSKKSELAQAEEMAKKQAEYQALVAEADQFFEGQKLDDAEAKYKAALVILDEQYPKDQISKIEDRRAELAANQAEEAQAEEMAKKEAEYQSLVAEADQFLEGQKLNDAEAKYKAALVVLDKQYPKDQISKIEERRAELAASQAEQAQAEEMAKKEADYQALIAAADGLLADEQLDNSEAKYKEALTVLDKQYPKDQISKIASRKAELAKKQASLSAAAELEENYKQVITAADFAFQSKDYKEALAKYEEALAIKEGDPHPVQRIEVINSYLEEERSKGQKETQYQNAIAAADAAMASEDYKLAKAEYQKALTIKSEESYPQEQIAKADGLLANEAAKAEEIRLKRERDAQNESAYQTAINEGDQLFSNKKYEQAINKYELAMGLKPGKTYPPEQIQRIRQKQEEDRLEAGRMAKEAEDREKRYIEIITSANQSFEKKDYQFAKREYEAALSMKPNEAFPKARIKEIESILRGGSLADKEEKVNDEPIKIQKGPKSTVSGDAEAELDRIYKEMWAKRDAEKNAKIVEKREVVKKLREEDQKKETSKRLNAIEQIENISISMVEQRQTADELHMQNFETVQNKTKVIEEKELELTKESERKRNETMLEKDRSLESIEEFRKVRSEEIVGGKKEMVEQDYEDEENFRKELMGVQQSNIEKKDDEFVMKEEEVREFNKERNDVNLNSNSKVLEQNEKDWKESVDTYNKGSFNRTEEEKEKVYQKEIDVREFAKEKNVGYLDGYEKVKVKTEDHEDFVDSKNKSSEDFRMNELDKISDLATEQQTERREGSQLPNDNYIKVIEKTDALKEEKTTLDKESEEKRQKNLEKEFYEGEDKPRQDPESANHPQGVSEKIIENDNGSTTIRRIRVEGTERDVYEKTLYPYGEIFYTKNGSNITKEAWDSESK